MSYSKNSCGALSSRSSIFKHCCCLLLFQQTDRYGFSSPHLSNRRQIKMIFLWTAIVSAVQNRALLCADVCGLLLFQRSEVERCSVQMSADCYCFSNPRLSAALCRCLRTAIVSAVRSRALLRAHVCGLLLFQRSDLERCFVQMSADCYCFSGPNSSVALCRYLRTAIVSAVRGLSLIHI